MEDDIHNVLIKQLKSQLLETTQEAIKELIAEYPEEFDLQNLIQDSNKDSKLNTRDRFLQLYEKTVEQYEDNSVTFDIHWHWTLPWRQSTSYKVLADSYSEKNVIEASTARSRKAVSQIFKDGLDPYMRWFPWRWFSDITLIGAGGFSAVYFAVLKPPYEVHDSVEDRIIALKVVDDKILNEIAVQSKAFNPVLFQGITVCETTGDLMMIMNLAEGGNLEDHIKRDPLADSDMMAIIDMAVRLATSLYNLHDEIEFCHRNIHPRNVICAESEYFLVDYRYSTPCDEATPVTRASKAHYGRVPYIAPEVRRGLYTVKSDVYSLGIILWQLVSKVLFPGTDLLFDGPEIYRIEPVPGVPQWFEVNVKVKDMIHNETTNNQVDVIIFNTTQDLYTACLEPTPQHRPNASEILSTLTHYSNLTTEEDMDERNMTNYVAERRLACHKHALSYRENCGKASPRFTGLYVLNKVPSFDNFIKLSFKKTKYRSPAV